MLKELLRKILPPPVEKVHEYRDRILDAIEDQNMLTYMQMKHTESLVQKLAAASGETIPETNLLAKMPMGRPHFAFSLASHCNLNCKGCAHFSSLSEEEYPDFEEAERDFARLGELFHGKASRISLMGGEPLLNPRVAEYCRMVRKYFPVGDIQVVTNGILLHKMPDSFYEACREARISIHVTPYPIKLDHEANRKRCRRFGVPYHFYWDETSKNEFFRYVIDETGSQDVVENFTNCANANYCLFLYKGRMYPCGAGAHFRIFNKHFNAGMELTDEDSVDIYRVRGGWELLLELAKPVPMCRYCVMSGRKETFTWGHSKKDKKEWT